MLLTTPAWFFPASVWVCCCFVLFLDFYVLVKSTDPTTGSYPRAEMWVSTVKLHCLKISSSGIKQLWSSWGQDGVTNIHRSIATLLSVLLPHLSDKFSFSILKYFKNKMATLQWKQCVYRALPKMQIIVSVYIPRNALLNQRVWAFWNLLIKAGKLLS